MSKSETKNQSKKHMVVLSFALLIAIAFATVGITSKPSDITPSELAGCLPQMLCGTQGTPNDSAKVPATDDTSSPAASHTFKTTTLADLKPSTVAVCKANCSDHDEGLILADIFKNPGSNVSLLATTPRPDNFTFSLE